MKSNTIWCMATSPEDEPTPLFVGRSNGAVEKYISIADADLGRPSLVMRGHVKAVTGMAAVTPDELYTCSLDGTVKLWNAEMEFDGHRVVKSIENKTPLRCLFMNDGKVYVGGESGSLIVIDGDRRSVYNGHKGAVTSIAVTMEGLVVTGGTDNQIRVWDISLGQTIRLLVGHQNIVKCLLVVEDEEEEDARGAILSFSSDRTMKVWLVPNPQDTLIEEDNMEEEKKFMVSFKEPKGGEEGNEMKNAAEAATAEEEKPPGEEGEVEGEEVAVDEEEDAQAAPIKSALKSKEKEVIRRDDALGTIELPEAPHCIFQEEESPMVYIGATGGYVYGIQAKTIASTVLKFVAKNKAMVRQDVRATKQTVKKSVSVYKRQCKTLVKKEEKRLLRIARRTLKEKKAKEREERKKVREAKAAERAAKRAQRDEDDEEEEDEEEEDEVEGEEEEEEEEEEENPDEEEEEENRLRILSDEQREELKKFIEEREKERNVKIKALEDAFADRLAKIEPLAKSTYDRRREEFHRLSWTTYTKTGGDGVVALTSVSRKVYVAQGDRVVPTSVTKGLTELK